MSLQNKLKRIILELEELRDETSYAGEDDELQKAIDLLQTIHLTEPL